MMPPRSKARTADSKSANVCSIHTGAAIWLRSSVGQNACLSRKRSRVRTPSESPFLCSTSVQWIAPLPSKQKVRVRIPCIAPTFPQASASDRISAEHTCGRFVPVGCQKRLKIKDNCGVGSTLVSDKKLPLIMRGRAVVARRPHESKVAGSSPAPAPISRYRLVDQDKRFSSSKLEFDSPQRDQPNKLKVSKFLCGECL